MDRKCIVIPLDLGAVMASAFLLFNGQLYKKPISQPSAVVAASACGNICLWQHLVRQQRLQLGGW